MISQNSQGTHLGSESFCRVSPYFIPTRHNSCRQFCKVQEVVVRIAAAVVGRLGGWEAGSQLVRKREVRYNQQRSTEQLKLKLKLEQLKVEEKTSNSGGVSES